MQNKEKKEYPHQTLRSLLNNASSQFTASDIENPRASAEILCAAALGVRRIDLYVDSARPVDAPSLKRFHELMERRLRREPVAYILGEKEFWSLHLTVTPDVLIPRPETELLVETVLRLLPQNRENRVLELGTGSGAIVIALARERKKDVFFASDRSFRGLNVARSNAEQHGVSNRIHFFMSDWLKAVHPSGGHFDLIVSNPPYIVDTEIPSLQAEIAYEPRLALDGGPDGLDSIREIIQNASDHLNPNGYLMLEIGKGQAEGVRELLNAWKNVQILHDYSRIERVAVAQKRDTNQFIA